MTRATLAFAAALAFAGPSFADEKSVKEVTAALKELNAAFETGNADAIRKLMTDDHLAVTPWGGRQTRDEQVKSLPDLKLTAYKAGDMTFTPVGTDGVLIVYPLAMKGTFRGTPVPTESQAAAVWVRRGGVWKELYYHETSAVGK